MFSPQNMDKSEPNNTRYPPFPAPHTRTQNIYANTQEGNGQKWLMIDLEDDNKQYEDIKKIINIKVCGK